MASKVNDKKTVGRAHLTLERIRKIPTPTGPHAYYFDDDPRQLCVRVTATGAKSYVYRGKLAGVSLRITIGSTDVWNLDDARTEARRLQTLIDNGDDPREVQAEKQAAKDAKREESKRRDSHALDVWLEYAELRRANWSNRHYAEHLLVAKAGGEIRTRGRRTGEPALTTPGILRPLLEMPLQRIDADKVRQWLKDESGNRPTYARLAFSLLRAFLNWCADRPEYRAFIHADACAARLARDELPKKSAKDDYLQREQLPLWFEHVRKLANPVHSAYLQALLITGARREELAELRWEDCDFQWKSMNIHDKVDGQRMIPLTPFVASLLSALPRRNEWVFSSPAAASGRLMEPRIAHNKALTAAGLPVLSLHGLRRSFGTLAEWVECPAGVSAQIMGHKLSAIAEKHYRRRPLDLLRQWHVKIEAWILEQAGVTFQEDAPTLKLVALNSKKAIL